MIDIITPTEYMNPSHPHTELARHILAAGHLDERDVVVIRRADDLWWIAECLTRDYRGHIIQDARRTVAIRYSDHQTDPR